MTFWYTPFGGTRQSLALPHIEQRSVRGYAHEQEIPEAAAGWQAGQRRATSTAHGLRSAASRPAGRRAARSTSSNSPATHDDHDPELHAQGRRAVRGHRPPDRRAHVRAGLGHPALARADAGRAGRRDATRRGRRASGSSPTRRHRPEALPAVPGRRGHHPRHVPQGQAAGDRHAGRLVDLERHAARAARSPSSTAGRSRASTARWPPARCSPGSAMASSRPGRSSARSSPTRTAAHRLGNLNEAMQAGWELQFARGWLTPTELRALLWAGAGADDPAHLRRSSPSRCASSPRSPAPTRCTSMRSGRPGSDGEAAYYVMDPIGRPDRGYNGYWWPASRGRGRGHQLRRRQDHHGVGVRRRHRPERPVPVAPARCLPSPRAPGASAVALAGHGLPAAVRPVPPDYAQRRPRPDPGRHPGPVQRRGVQRRLHARADVRALSRAVAASFCPFGIPALYPMTGSPPPTAPPIALPLDLDLLYADSPQLGMRTGDPQRAGRGRPDVHVLAVERHGRGGDRQRSSRRSWTARPSGSPRSRSPGRLPLRGVGRGERGAGSARSAP